MPEATQPGSDWPLPGKTLGFPSLAAHSCTFQKEWGIKTKSSGIVLKNRGSCALRKKVGRKARTVGGKRRAMGVFGDDAGLHLDTRQPGAGVSGKGPCGHNVRLAPRPGGGLSPF